jgi:hypothetical protein
VIPNFLAEDLLGEHSDGSLKPLEQRFLKRLQTASSKQPMKKDQHFAG